MDESFDRCTDIEEIKTLIQRLKAYNEWRRGADTEMPSPKQIGTDIDNAINLLSEYKHFLRTE